MKKPPLEKVIQMEICEHLKSKGFLFWRVNNTPTLGRPGADGKVRFRAMPKFGRMGVPDILVLTKGIFIGLEIKRTGKILSPYQELFRDDMHKNGGFYFTIYSKADLPKILL